MSTTHKSDYNKTPHNHWGEIEAFEPDTCEHHAEMLEFARHKRNSARRAHSEMQSIRAMVHPNPYLNHKSCWVGEVAKELADEANAKGIDNPVMKIVRQLNGTAKGQCVGYKCDKMLTDSDKDHALCNVCWDMTFKTTTRKSPPKTNATAYQGSKVTSPLPDPYGFVRPTKAMKSLEKGTRVRLIVETTWTSQRHWQRKIKKGDIGVITDFLLLYFGPVFKVQWDGGDTMAWFKPEELEVCAADLSESALNISSTSPKEFAKKVGRKGDRSGRQERRQGANLDEGCDVLSPSSGYSDDDYDSDVDILQELKKIHEQQERSAGPHRRRAYEEACLRENGTRFLFSPTPIASARSKPSVPFASPY